MSDPFASASDLAQFMGSPLQDDLSREQFLLELASATIRRYCDQELSFVSGDVVTFAASERDTLILPERPVIAVTSVVEGAVPVTAYTFTRAGLLHRTITWSLGATVTYNHGYTEDTEQYKAIKAICLAAAARAFTLNERSASEALGSTLMESAGYSPEVFLTPGEKMQLMDLGKVLVG